MKKNILLISILVIFLAIPFNLLSQSWPQFMGPERNGKVTGFKVPAKWPAELKQVWRINVGFGDATPVLLEKRIYVAVRQGDEEVILCLDSGTGKEIWRSSYKAAAVTGPATSHPGPRSTPAIADGKIVTFGVTGILSCFDVNTGKLLWRKENPDNAVPQFFTGMSPLIIEGTCIVHLGSKDNGEVVAFDLATGKEKWKWEGDGPSYASPSLLSAGKEKHIIVQTEMNLIALSFADGRLLWKIPTPPSQRFYNCTSPYVNGQIIYFTGQGTGTKAVQAVSNEDNWTTRELWSNTDIGAKWNTPILKDGYLYGFTDQRRIYCLDATTGKTAWYDNNANSDFASILDCGSVIIGLPSTGNLLVLKPDPKAYTEIARYKVAETPVFAFPVIAGNIIYIKDNESLTMYSIE